MGNRHQRDEIDDGLEDVVVTRTRLSRVDGEHGRLTIAGEPVGTLTQARTFEEILGLLLERADSDRGPKASVDGPDWQRQLGRARAATFDRLAGGSDPAVALLDDPMASLRAAVAALPSSGDDRLDAVRVVAAAATATATWWRLRRDEEPVEPDPALAHVADYLRMLHGDSAPEEAADAVEQYLVAVSDHGLNASTFTTRVITSTGADLISAAAGAVGALKGPLHGGAPGPVLDMLDAIDEAGDAEQWLSDRLDDGKRIMGMGHRVYRTRDPRADVFERAVEQLRGSDTVGGRLDLAREVERTAQRLLAERHPDRELRANVEFYTAVLLEAAGVPPELFTNTFTVGRSAGWMAHALEQRRTGRLIRPRSQYVDTLA
ncbi:MAG: citrate synthase [Bradymonadaceae bacterium]